MANDLQAGAHQTLDWTLWWTQADTVVQLLAVVLLFMSIVTWTVIGVLWRQRMRQADHERSQNPQSDSVQQRFVGQCASVLGGIAALAPFVGLLGTVWGIMQTLIALGAHSQLSFQMIAAPLGEALLMTAAGLFVAIPAAAAYRVAMHISDMDKKAAFDAMRMRLMIPNSPLKVGP